MKTQSFAMRLFSVLLCVAMVCTFAPITTFAAAPDSVFVGGVEVTQENASDVLGDGAVSYDEDTATLTLNGATVIDSYERDNVDFGIYSDGDLNVVIKGDVLVNLAKVAGGSEAYGIYSDGGLSVTGDGSISLLTPNMAIASTAICAAEALNYAVSGKTTVSGAAASEGYAFQSLTDDIVFDCAAEYNVRANTAVFASFPTFRNEGALYYAYAAKDDNRQQVITVRDGITVEECDGMRLFQNEAYETDVYVCNVPITSLNGFDVFGNGTVSYDFERNELVLNNAHLTDITYDDGISDISIIHGMGGSDLVIRLIGDNVLDTTDFEFEPGEVDYNQAIYVEGALRLVGDGNLTCTVGPGAEGGSYAVYAEELSIYGTGDYKFCAAEMDEALDSYGVFISYGKIALSGSRFEEGKDHGIYVSGSSKASNKSWSFTDGLYEAYYTDTMDGASLVKANVADDYEDAKQLYFKSAKSASYGLDVCGVAVTSTNAGDVLGDGTVSFRSDINQLTLDNATLTVAGSSMYDDDISAIVSYDTLSDLTIKLIGDNVIDLADFEVETGVRYLQGVCTECDTLVNGSGSLTIAMPQETAAYVYGFYTPEDGYFRNEGGLTITAADSLSGQYVGIFVGGSGCLDAAGIRISAGRAVDISALYRNDELDYYGSTTYGGSMTKVTSKIEEDFYSSTYKELETKPADYDLTVGGVRVTAENYNNILGDGSASYSPDENTLYLRNADIVTDTDGISYGGSRDFTVWLDGQNTITAISETDNFLLGIHASGKLTVAGTGSLDMTVDGPQWVKGIDSCETYLENIGDITISVLDSSVVYAAGVYGEDALEFKGAGDVTVTMGRCGNEGYGAFSNGGIVFSGAGNLSFDVEGAENYAAGIYCDGNMTCSGTGVISATGGETQSTSYGLLLLGTLTLQTDTMSGGKYYFEGYDQAIYAENAPNIGDYSMSASNAVTGGGYALSPSLANLADYKRVWFNPPHSINDIADIVVSNNENAVVNWTFGDSTTPDYMYVFADTSRDGSFSEQLGGGAWDTFKSFTRAADSLASNTYAWRVAACYGGDIDELGTTVIYSKPFDVTFYEVLTEVAMYTAAPAIGQPVTDYCQTSLSYVCNNKATVTWFDLDTMTEMAKGKSFKAGHNYGVQITCQLLSNAYRVAENATLYDMSGTKLPLTPIVDTATNTVVMQREYLNLQDEIAQISYSYNEPVEGQTPADLSVSVKGQLQDGTYVNITKSAPTLSWKYCEMTDTYSEDEAIVMADDEEFVGGNYYKGYLTVPLKDCYTAVVGHYSYKKLYSQISTNDNTVIDSENNTVTYVFSFGQVKKSISRLDILLEEPEVGHTAPSDVIVQDSFLANHLYDYYIEWAEIKEDGISSTLDSSTEFEVGKSYEVYVWFEFEDFIEFDGKTAFTVNGQEMEGRAEDYYAYVMLNYGPLETSEELESININVFAPIAGQTIADAAAYVEPDETIAFSYNTWYRYDTDLLTYVNMEADEVFVEGEKYGVQMNIDLKTGYIGTEDTKLTVNGTDEDLEMAPGMMGDKYAMFFWTGNAVAAPTLSLAAAGATTLEKGDAGLSNVEFTSTANFEPVITSDTKKVVLTVKDASDTVVFTRSYDEMPSVVSADLSGDTLAVGTYKVSLSAFINTQTITSNEVEIEVKAKPTTTTETTTTATAASKTESSATATATEAKSSATVTETKVTGTVTETKATGTVTETEATATATGTEANTVMYGDANGDNAVNMKDVLLLRKYLAGMAVTMDMASADVNGDGNINMKDVLELRKYLAGISSTLGPKG